MVVIIRNKNAVILLYKPWVCTQLEYYLWFRSRSMFLSLHLPPPNARTHRQTRKSIEKDNKNDQRNRTAVLWERMKSSLFWKIRLNALWKNSNLVDMLHALAHLHKASPKSNLSPKHFTRQHPSPYVFLRW